MPRTNTSIGLDTPFLLAHSLLEHPDHKPARERAHDLLERTWRFSICETVLAEFVHVITDSNRFKNPATMEQALRLAESWLNNRETSLVAPTTHSITLALDWLGRHRLGRKRILDTTIAATYHSAGIKTILTSNIRDFQIFGCFQLIDFSQTG